MKPVANKKALDALLQAAKELEASGDDEHDPVYDMSTDTEDNVTQPPASGVQSTC